MLPRLSAQLRPLLNSGRSDSTAAAPPSSVNGCGVLGEWAGKAANGTPAAQSVAGLTQWRDSLGANGGTPAAPNGRPGFHSVGGTECHPVPPTSEPSASMAPCAGSCVPFGPPQPPQAPQDAGPTAPTYGATAPMVHGCSLPFGPSLDAGMAYACGHGHAASACSRLHLLVPRRAVEGVLVPRGHLAEIAQRCCVQIDLEGSARDLDATILTLTGSVAANALAALHLQWRVMQCA